MNPFQTPFDRLISVNAPRKPVRGKLWWADFTFAGIALIGVVCCVIAYFGG